MTTWHDFVRRYYGLSIYASLKCKPSWFARTEVSDDFPVVNRRLPVCANKR